MTPRGPAAATPAEVVAAVRTQYALWGALGLSILAGFGLLLALQRQGVATIASSAAGAVGTAHLSAAAGLFAVAATAVALLRARARDPERLVPSAALPGAGGPVEHGRRALRRALALSLLAWAVAEALAWVGFALALALPPVPRLALVAYFTGALFLWLWSRPAPESLLAVWHRAAGAA